MHNITINSNNPLVHNHHVQQQPTLPGLAYIDLIYRELYEQGEDIHSYALKDMTVLNPLIIAENSNCELQIQLSQISKGFSIKITGTTPDQNTSTLLFVTAKAIRKQVSIGPKRNFNDLEKIGRSINLESIYQHYKVRKLEHSGFMKAIGALEYYDSEWISRVSLSDFARDSADAFLFHPTLLDGAVVSLAFGVKEDVKTAGVLFLPIHIEEVIIRRYIQNECYAVVSKESISYSGDLLKFSISFYDTQGNQLAELKNFSAKRLRTATEKISSNTVTHKEKTLAKGNVPAESYLRNLFESRSETPAHQIQNDAGFYDWGMSSSELMTIVDELGQKIGVELSPTLLFEYTTLESLAKHLQKTYPSVFGMPDASISSKILKKKMVQPSSETIPEDQLSPSSTGDIAIIGLSGRYPKADNLDEFWKNLTQGVDAITTIPKSRWNWKDYEGMKTPSGKSISKWGGFINDIAAFDAPFFKISPKEAENLDPQERWFLQTCWEAIEDAGYTPDTIVQPTGKNKLRQVGVFAGVMHKDYGILGWDQLQKEQANLSLNYAPIPNRVSYFCNFHGPSMAVDTVCSSSLTAIHLAIQSLQNKECKVALAGGVNLSLHPAKYISYGLSNFHATDGRCRAFGTGGDGYVSSEGVGVTLLKPLEDAIRDQDEIYAVIKGSSINHVGKVSGITVPGPMAQQELISACYEKYNINPEQISYIEAHGTGTLLGDPIEVDALTKAFREKTNKSQYCGIGSLKSNIGHTEAASGIASLTKVALQLHHKKRVPTLHASDENPHLKLNKTPFYVQKNYEDWEQNEGARIAGISSFGATGTNVHLVLQEYVPDHKNNTDKKLLYQGPVVVPISAKNKVQLVAYVDRLLKQLIEAKPLYTEQGDSIYSQKTVETAENGKEYRKPIQEKLASLLRVDPKNVSLDIDWLEFGMDTYQYSELQDWLQQSFSFKAEISDLDRMNIESLSKELSTRFSENTITDTPEDSSLYYLQQVGYAFQTGRVELEERAVFIVTSLDELITKLHQYVQDDKEGADYKANITDHEQLFATFASDEDFYSLISNWLQKGKITKVAEIWTKGYHINWTEMYQEKGTPGRTKVPTYPFSKKEYWLPIVDKIKENDDKGEKPVQQITPLVHRNESGFEHIRFSSFFTGNEFFLTDHNVKESAVLPGVAHLEAAYQSFINAVGKPTPTAVTISDVHFIRPVISKDNGCEIAIELERQQDDYSYTISQQGILASQGNIQVETNNKPSQKLEVQPYYNTKDYESTDGTAIYAQFDRMGIQYGIAHQCITRAFHNTDEVAVHLVLEKSLDETLSSYQLHPGLVDAALQATLLLEKSAGQSGWKSLTQPKMPFAIGQLTIYKPCTSTMWAVVKLEKHIENGDTISSIKLYNDSLELVTTIQGFITKEVAKKLTVTEALSSPSDEYKDAEMVHLLPSWEIMNKSKIKPSSDVDTEFPYLCINCPEEAKDSIRKRGNHIVFTTHDDLLATQFEVLKGKEPCFQNILWWVSNTHATLQQAQEEGVYFGYKLLRACIASNYDTNQLFWTIITTQTQTFDGYPVSDPSHAGVEGLMSSAIKEYYQWHMRLIDLAQDSVENYDQLSQIPFDKEGRIWAIRDGEWYRQQITPLQVNKDEILNQSYQKHGVYVIIGGAGNIGRIWTKYLIKHFDATVVWIGRSERSETILNTIQKVETNGSKPDYYQANVTLQPEIATAFQEIKKKYGPINAVINAAMVLEEQALVEISETGFREGYETKQKSICNLVSVLQHEPLDFLLLFSSMVSFIKTPRLSYYAAGNTFMDAFAKSAQHSCAFPIKTVNWGYWQGDQLEEAKDFDKLKALGIQPITATEGIEALDLLMQTHLAQLGIMKFSKPLDFSGYRKDTKYSYTAKKLESKQVIDLGIERYITPEKISELEYQSAYEDETFTDLTRQLVYHQLDSIGVLDQATAVSKLESWGTPMYFKDWLVECLSIFNNEQETHVLNKEALWKSWNEYSHREKENPDKKFHIALIDATLKALPQILKNEVRPTDILFPNSSMDKVVNIYKNNTISDYYNEVLSTCLVAYVNTKLEENPDLKIRILEVGAGTGGTSALLFEKLRPLKESIAEYCYTDISQAFLNFAQTTYAEGNPYLTFKKFNAEDSIQSQPFEVGDYDIVLGTNVLHATSNIRTSLKNCQSLLKPGGLFLLNEISKNLLFTHLTFGLLEGWWLPTDKETRISGCPGLSPLQWEKVLLQSGYEEIRFPLEPVHRLGQQIVWALAKEVREENIVQNATLDSEKVVHHEEAVIPNKKLLADGEQEKSYEDQVTTYLRNVVSKVLKLPIDEVSVKDPFENYGIDSILIVQLTNELRKDFDDIPGTLFFEYQNLDAMVSYFMSNQNDAVKSYFDSKRTVITERASIDVVEEVVSSKQETPVLEDDPQPSIKPIISKKEVLKEPNEEIAVIGLAGKYPGSDTVQEYWENLKSSKNCISEIPSDRWEWQRYFGEKGEIENGSYSRWGGFMNRVDHFDPLFFKISPLEAEKMDPQERLFLQSAYTAIEDAGYLPQDLSPTKRVGVFAGVMNSTYNRQANHWSISNRVSYALDFQGPSLTVDTACSSSLMAIYLAVESIQSGQCDCAIAGGVNVIATPGHYNRLASANMLSKGDQNNTFGAGADGFVDSEGVGTLLLKPKSKAIADGDVIYGIIKGGSTNSGGRTTGYTVPNPVAQADLIVTALERTKVHPESISYVEAHGTGTALGDPIEILGLTKAYSKYTDRKQFCAIGSSKSNIGHCESAAGIGGLTKILFQFVNQQQVPSLHNDPSNSEINFASSPFYIQKDLQFWKAPKVTENGALKTYPRRAAISSFGAGGTNVHLILEEAPSIARTVSSQSELIVLSGATQEQLQETVRRLLTYLQEEKREVSLASMAFTLQVGRKASEYRLAFEASDTRVVMEVLASYLKNPNSSFFHTGTVLNSRSVASKNQGRYQKWFENNEWNEIAIDWVTGVNILWNELYHDKPSRVSLPTYPFAKESYWKPEAEYDAKSSLESDQKTPEDKNPISKLDNPVVSLTEPVSYYVETFRPASVTVQEPIMDSDDLMIKSKREHNYEQLRGKEIFLENLQTQQDWSDMLGKFRGSKIIWIHPEQSVAPLDNAYRDDTYESLRALFRFAKACQAVGLDRQPIDWVILTRNAQKLDTELVSVSPMHAAVGSLAVVLGKELKKWRLRIVDSLESISKIPEWSVASNEPQQWVLRNENIYQKKIISFQGIQEFTSPYKLGGTYLIAGGSGGVGIAWSEYLINTYQAKIIWIGRRPLDTGIQSRMKEIDLEGKHVVYYQADIADYITLSSVYTQIRKDYGTINGVIHAAMASTDEHIHVLNESRFEQGLRAKIDGSLAIGKVFENEPLDFMVFFSSIGSIAAMEGQSCYVSSSSFKDSFSHYLNQRLKYPVKVVNWGYWGAVGFGAFIPGKLQDLLREQAGVLEPKAANQQLEAFIASLNQQAVITEKAKFEELISLDLDSEIYSNTEVYSSVIQQLEKHAPDRYDTAKELRTNGQFGIEEMEPLLAKWMLVQLQSIGLLTNKQNNLEEQKQQNGFNRFYDKWLEESLRVMQNNGLITVADHDWITLQSGAENLQKVEVESNWGIEKRVWEINTYKKAQVKLLESSMQHLPKVLTGKMKGAEVVFPDSSMELVEGIYKNELGDYFNDVLTDNIIAFIKERIKQDPDAKIRLLEVGAGIGGTSSVVFERIRPYEAYIETYCYTDISKAFLHYAEEEYGPSNSYLSYSLFNVGVPAPQNQIEETYDIVLATNVLHATDDIRNTLVNVKSVLRKNGVLLINEISVKSLFFHMGFALLDGWWLYNDPELRIEGCPGLAPDMWNHILNEHGFDSIVFPVVDAHDLGQQIIVAQSDGVILRKAKSMTVASDEIPSEVKKQVNSDTLVDQIQTIISDILKIPKEKIRQDVSFLDYGLDSIIAVKLVKTIRDVIGLPVESSHVFEHDTIEKLLAYYQGEVNPSTVVSSSHQQQSITEDSTPTVDILSVLKTIINETLKVPIEKIRKDASLYDYGLDSILAVEITKKINTLLHTQIDTNMLLQNDTITELIDKLSSQIVTSKAQDTSTEKMQPTSGQLDKTEESPSRQKSFEDEQVLKVLEDAQTQNLSAGQILERIV